jgi:hypothetical protein
LALASDWEPTLLLPRNISANDPSANHAAVAVFQAIAFQREGDAIASIGQAEAIGHDPLRMALA